MERFTERILLSVTPDQKSELQARAKQARLTLTDYLRRKALDQPIGDSSEPIDHERLDALERRIGALEQRLAPNTPN